MRHCGENQAEQLHQSIIFGLLVKYKNGIFQFWLYTARFIDYERVKRIRVGNWVIIVSGNGLSPVGRQAITQINAILFSVGLGLFL